MKTSLSVLALLAGTKADQPVHCMSGDIYGEWTFFVSKEKTNVNLFDSQDVCTHNLPNGLQILTQSHNINFAEKS